jgi:Spy/CpxP family protein refolding chaperone
MNTRRAIQTFAGLALSLTVSIAFAAGANQTTSSAAAQETGIPTIVITAKRLTPEQKASLDQAEEGQDMKKMASKKNLPKPVKAGGGVG